MKDVKRFLLHIKALVWCLHRVCQKYNLTTVIESLKEGKIHPSLVDTNLGENIKYIIDNIENENDIQKLIQYLNDVPKHKVGLSNLLKNDDEVGYYIKSLEQIGDVPPGCFGVVMKSNSNLEVIFYLDKEGLIKKIVKPDQIELIPGTYPQ